MFFEASTNIYKTNNHLSSQPKNTKTTTYGVGNPGPGLGQAQKCHRVKPVNPPLLITGSPTSIHI
jgi:hypothetical protein